MGRTIEKMTIGRVNKSVKITDNNKKHYDVLPAIGLCTMCLMLAFAMLPQKNTDMAEHNYSESVAVMSTSVANSSNTEREELVLPDRKTSTVEENSVFETIGEFFASLISGEQS